MGPAGEAEPRGVVMAAALGNGARVSPVGSGVLHVEWQGHCSTSYRTGAEVANPIVTLGVPAFTVRVAGKALPLTGGWDPAPVIVSGVGELVGPRGTVWAPYRAEFEIPSSAAVSFYDLEVIGEWAAFHPLDLKMGGTVPMCLGTTTVEWFAD